MSRLQVVVVAVILVATSIGCSRHRHRMRADRDTYSLLNEQTACAPWHPGNFTIDTSVDSRLAPISPLDDPCLPTPAPSLYAYQLPEIAGRDSTRFRGDVLDIGDRGIVDEIVQLSRRSIWRLPNRRPFSQQAVQLTGFHGRHRQDVALAFLADDAPRFAASVSDGVDDAFLFPNESLGGRRIVPIARVAWDSIPRNCLMRTLEFDSVAAEFERTYRGKAGEELFDAADRLALEDLLEIAVANSREYQTQKEQLYRAALRLSLERYAYQLKFVPSGNGVGLDWRHRNDAGITENSLGISSGAAVEKILASGGNLLARFANDVVLTFNGPSGFTSDVGSELLAEITQPLLQRDIVFERLTQAERDVVYAARDYARFRKQFFRDIAADYYQLLLTYRSIEIDMLDFFANQRGFDEARNEYQLRESLPRFQVDQFEQNALNSRSRVIRSCNNLEQSFDGLKLRIGIPPETSINLDLTELEILTARDEIVVAAEFAIRARQNLTEEIQVEAGASQNEQPDRVLVVNASIQLAQKLQALFQLQNDRSENSDSSQEGLQAATDLLNKLEVEAAVITADENRAELMEDLDSPRLPSPAQLTFSRMNLIRSLIILGQQHRLAYQQAAGDATMRDLARRYSQLAAAQDELYERLSEPNQLEKVAELSAQAGELLREVEAAVRVDERLDATNLVKAVLLLGEELRGADVGGLAPIELPVDEAMLTALVTRFDLMNQRGSLADAWRQIKLAGDDLRSVLNLRASQTIRTDSAVNRPFDFTFDESETRLGLTFDAPLNRRAQRNTYRIALINYNVALRNLSQLEDEIKFALRSDLRNLQLDREQYAIAVASAALASDRRLSTRKQLDLGQGNITARDFLEAQQAYTASLNGVASAHIDYILDRIDLFLDLELLQVDDRGFWPQLYDESYEPELRMQPPEGSGPAYGCLPDRLHYSDCIRRMDCIPFGLPRVYDHDIVSEGVAQPLESPTPSDGLGGSNVPSTILGPDTPLSPIPPINQSPRSRPQQVRR